MTVRRHPVRQHPRRTATGPTVVGRHMRGDGETNAHNLASARAALPDLTTRFLGSCQICAGDFKLDDSNLMVHHGYKRPGDGSIHGDCMGVGYAPYEVSCERCKPYLAGLQKRAEGLSATIAEYESPSFAQFTVHELRWYPRPAKMIAIEFVKNGERLNDYRFEEARKNQVYKFKSDLGSIQREIKRMETRIADWAPKPIRTIEEMTRQLAEKADVRKGEREIARAAKQAKIEATKAKQAALLAKRTAIIDALRADVLATYDRKLAGEDVAKDVEKLHKRYGGRAFRDAAGGWMFRKALAGASSNSDADTPVDIAMIGLGLVYRSPFDGHPDYR